MMEMCETMIDIEKELNEEQLEAAKHLEGPLLVLAGAGSGKTRCVTYRIVNLLQNGVPSYTILGLTFTNKAAKEMKERIESLVNQKVLISTFHSLGARMLRESIEYLGYKSSFTIYDEDDADKLIKTCVQELNLADMKADSKLIKSMISNAKNQLQSPDDIDTAIAENEVEEKLPALYRCYQQKLKEYNAVDFDDLLYLPVKLLKEHPEVLQRYQERWQFLLIDEYQDTNAAQYELVKLLVAQSQNVFVVGDPDQSIYSWRGANIENILNFEKDFKNGKVVRLEQNYRSTQNILSASNDLITNNQNRFDKNLWSNLGQGEKIKQFIGETEHDEARFISERVRYYHEEMDVPLSEMVIFYRTNFQSRVFEDHLLQRNIPYSIIGGISFYQRKEIKDIVAYVRMVTSPADYISFARTINLPKRGIGNASIDKIRMTAASAGVNILDFCRNLLNGEAGEYTIRLTKKQKEGLTEYVEIIDELKKMQQSGASIHDIFQQAVESSGYLSHLSKDQESYDDRKANIDELIGKAEEWNEFVEEPTLEAFLEEMSLKSNLDETVDSEDRLNLMTLHNGKGLEFRIVFIVGLENELLPHANSRGSYEALEEERRLFYVGITRGKEQVYFSSAFSRNMWGQHRSQRPSRFIDEISPEYIEQISFVEGRHRSMRTSKIDMRDSGEKQKTFSPGDAVFHASFGVGIVQQAYEGSLGEMVDVLFTNESHAKSLALKYAKLKRL
ncbi:MAG: UvrD-helicase domain-containing protein [Chlamydiota bacterium]|nr:UvrD-helicase domain-containing protein [Chlamydiota bacterium]